MGLQRGERENDREIKRETDTEGERKREKVCV